jgi:hypothetical protein
MATTMTEEEEEEMIVVVNEEEKVEFKDPQNGYLDDIWTHTPAPMHRDGPFCVAVDGCGSIAELCECHIS